MVDLNMEAERAAFEAWAKSQNWVCDRNSFGEYQYGTATDGWAAWQAARRAAPVVADDSLPPLPEPDVTTISGRTFYTAEQYRQGQRDAIAADRAARAAGCGQCPRDTPYGPATCGKCMEADEKRAQQKAQSVDTPAPRIKSADEQDPLYEQAVRVVLAMRRASVSLVQRHLMIGYNRASRLIEAMEGAGVVSPFDQNGHRTVIDAAPSPQHGKEGA